MGVYDTIIAKCPECGVDNYFQSKSGECILADYRIELAPIDVMMDANRHTPERCKGCDKLLFVDINNRKLRLATDEEIKAAEVSSKKFKFGIKHQDLLGTTWEE